MLLNTLLFISGLVLVFGALISYASWFKFKHRSLKFLFYFWLSGLFALVAQASVEPLSMPGLLALGTNSIIIYYFLKLYFAIVNCQRSMTIYNCISGLAVITGFAVAYWTEDFFWGASIYCLASSGILIHGALSLFNPNSYIFHRAYQGLLLLAALFLISYPLLSVVAPYSILGFSVLLSLFVGIFAPFLILQKTFFEYERTFEPEVQLRTQHVQESYTKLKDTFDDLKNSRDQVNTLLSDSRFRMSALVHDIASPLQIVWHYFKIMCDNPAKSPELITDKGERIRDAIDSIRQILEEARGTHSELLGKAELTLKKVNLRELTEDVIKIYDERIQEKNISLRIDFGPYENIAVQAHKGWLKNHVLANLISNAIKFSNLGGQITIRAYHLDAQHVAVVVEDDGIGIPFEKQEAIFTFDKPTTTLGTLGEKGTGLGLPIVKQYTELMGGKISLVERESQGTSFQIQLKKAA